MRLVGGFRGLCWLLLGGLLIRVSCLFVMLLHYWLDLIGAHTFSVGSQVTGTLIFVVTGAMVSELT